MSILRLAIPTPLRQQFDYLPPADFPAEQLSALQPGCRVRVPFGRREVTGYLLEVREETDQPRTKLKAAITLVDTKPLIDSLLFKLCLWAASYYHHPLGEVIAAAFPAKLRQGQPHQTEGTPGWCMTTQGKGLPEGALSRSPRQALALSMLLKAGELPTQDLSREGITTAILRALKDKGLIEPCQLPLSHQSAKSLPGLTLNPEQSAAVSAIEPTLGEFHCHLLEGITGSGKTEVYLQLINRCLEQGRQALVLVPEIGLTPQTLRRFTERFDARIVSLHSGLGDAQRQQGWEAARSGSAHIVIGTRSSIFAPFEDLGLIIVDEEHDGSYKQQGGFRYSARDIAVKRGQLSRCPVVLGSATPSLESIHNVNTGRYAHHYLSQRAGNALLPRLKALDIRKQTLSAGMSAALLTAVEETLGQAKQALLFLNRRGFAPTLLCHDCGWLAECSNCDARFTVHRRQRTLRCHHCGAARALPDSCPDCHGNALMTSGLGTEQAEEFLRQRFPGVALYRVDSDSMRGKSAMQTLVKQLNEGEPCILLGTQMLTKGHHFPAVNLVGVIDADAVLFSADFRGEERMSQLLTQVAGRAGREGEQGRVLIQTHYPDHPVINAIITAPYGEHARAMLEERLTLNLPPASSMALVRTDATDASRGDNFLQQLRRNVAPHLPANTTLLGPLPSPMQRRAGKFRSQLLLNGRNRGDTQRAAAMLVAEATRLRAGQLTWTIDIDPQDSF